MDLAADSRSKPLKESAIISSKSASIVSNVTILGCVLRPPGFSLPHTDVLCNWLRPQWAKIPVFEIKGSLARCLPAWRRLGAHDFILDIVSNGYRIPFKSTPPPFSRANHVAARKDSDFVMNSIAELLRNGWAEIVPTPPTCINPLHVAHQPNGKKRLILDLTYVNRFIQTQRFKMDTLQVAAPFFSENGWAFIYDILKGYYHIDISLEFRTYLGFSFELKGVVFYAQYTVCPFGLSPAPWLFTKLLRPVVTSWRSAGMIHFLYLDDGVGVNASRAQCAIESQRVRSDLLSLGFHEQPDKCQWEPTQCIKWLGFIVDLKSFCIRAPPEKVNRVRDVLTVELSAEMTTCRRLLRLSGLINCLTIVYGNVALLLSKPFYIQSQLQLDAGLSYNSKFPVPPDVYQALLSWHSCLDRFKPFRSLRYSYPTLLCFSDASASGGASFLHHLSIEQSQACALPLFAQNLIRKTRYSDPPAGELSDSLLLYDTPSQSMIDVLTDIGANPSDRIWPASHEQSLINWSETDAQKSSTYRELKALVQGLHSFVDSLAGRSLYWATDNTGVEAIMIKGSMKPELHALALEAFELLQSKQIDLIVLWVPRSMNVVADTLSRQVDYDDWAISSHLFQQLDQFWGPHSVDRFSSDLTAQTKRFNSRYACPNTEGVDCFLINWHNENNWLVPPPRLVAAAIRHLLDCKAYATLVVPYWVSAPFWPLLFPGGKPAWYIIDSYTIPNAAPFIMPGPQPHSIFHPKSYKGSLLALRLCTR